MHSPLPQVKIVKGDDYKGVLDFAGRYQLRQVGDGDEPGDQVLALVELDRVQAAAVLDHHGEAGIAHDGWVRENPADEARVLRLRLSGRREGYQLRMKAKLG